MSDKLCKQVTELHEQVDSALLDLLDKTLKLGYTFV